jgi:hypothetical protein
VLHFWHLRLEAELVPDEEIEYDLPMLGIERTGRRVS